MILKILLKLWPALIPIILYLLWLVVKNYYKNKNYIDGEFKEVNPKKVHEEKQNYQNKLHSEKENVGDFSLKNRNFILVIYFSLFAIIISFLLFAFLPNNGKDKAELPIYEINIKNHTFYPNIIEVKKNREFKILVHNLDATAEEFQTSLLRKKKIIAPHSQAIFLIELEESGEYEFFGELHKETANGIIVAK